jgi:hypothetical protein
MSDSSAQPVDRLWFDLSNSMKLVDDFNHRREQRRHTSCASMLTFLADHNVLMHSAYYFDQSKRAWCVTPEFARLCLAGESLLRAEVSRRLANVFPELSYDELLALVSAASERENLLRASRCLRLECISRPWTLRRQHPLTEDMLIRSLYAVLAELNWFVVKTKATDRTHNNALFPPSDALILHVLSSHLVESILAQRPISLFLGELPALKERWSNPMRGRPERFLAAPRRSKRLDITTCPLAFEGPDVPCDPQRTSKFVASPHLACAAGPTLAGSPVHPITTGVAPKLNWARFDRLRLGKPEVSLQPQISLMSQKRPISAAS